jgi:hypothetical protein
MGVVFLLNMLHCPTAIMFDIKDFACKLVKAIIFMLG